jgi:hypothetical protein
MKEENLPKLQSYLQDYTAKKKDKLSDLTKQRDSAIQIVKILLKFDSLPSPIISLLISSLRQAYHKFIALIIL